MSDFKIIEGLPEHVETDVNAYLSEGWTLNGYMFHRTVDGNNIAVQSVKRELPSENAKAIFVYQLTTTHSFDPQAMMNVMYHKQIGEPKSWRHSFSYIVKVLATSQLEAEYTISREFEYQLEVGGYSGEFEFINREEYNV